MKQILPAFGLIAPFVLVAPGLHPVLAQANDMFASRAAAEKRAKELKCSGSFAMGSEWMPCVNIATYEKAIQQQTK
jgi:hypothetical protein